MSNLWLQYYYPPTFIYMLYTAKTLLCNVYQPHNTKGRLTFSLHCCVNIGRTVSISKHSISTEHHKITSTAGPSLCILKVGGGGCLLSINILPQPLSVCSNMRHTPDARRDSTCLYLMAILYYDNV
jgi:hypothetical protein